jgi:hypothetical protein
MGQKLNNFIIRYTWLFPLLIMLGSTVYYINWFERLYAEDETAYHLSIFKELQISIGICILITALLNWALVGFWKHLYTGNCTPKWEIKKK